METELEHMDRSDLEAELYSLVHHDNTESNDILDQLSLENRRSVTKHSIINNKPHKKMLVKNRKIVNNPNPFALSSAKNIPNPISIPKRFTPYTSYLSQVDLKPIDDLISNEQRPNPFNQGFSRGGQDKLNRLQKIQMKKARADRIRKKTQESKAASKPMETEEAQINSSVDIINACSDDDEVYIYPTTEPPVYTIVSSDDENESEAKKVPPAEPNTNNFHDYCDDISVNCEKRLSHDPFGGIDATELNRSISDVHSINSTHNFAKPTINRLNTLNKSYEVFENDFAATDVYESESDFPECAPTCDKGENNTNILSDSEDSENDMVKRSKRMRKRKSSGSNRSSDYISSDESDNLTVETNTNKPYLFRGHAIYNAIAPCKQKQTGRLTNEPTEPNVDVGMNNIASDTDNSIISDKEGEQNNVEGKSTDWLVKDQVGEPDDVELMIPDIDDLANKQSSEQTESNIVDKDDANCVRSKALVFHPDMGWNNEMKVFYNESWGGEAHDTKALRREMPKHPDDWKIINADRRHNYHILKSVKCLNCRESGHRMAFCPQPKKVVLCYTCGHAGHREARCPNAICLKCGEKTNSYVRGCNRCHQFKSIVCKVCRRRGHIAKNCPDIWRCYHNITDNVSSPTRLPVKNLPRRYCSVCAGAGHTAEYCYDFSRILHDEPIPTTVRNYEKLFVKNPIDNSKITPYAMFAAPRENFKFNWNVNESSDRFYGRFMAATNFQRDSATNISSKPRAAKKQQLNQEIVVEAPEKLVLNPMNAKNMREKDKPKKQFSKNFYKQTTTAMALTKDDKIDTPVELPLIVPATSKSVDMELESIRKPEHSLEDIDVIIKDGNCTTVTSTADDNVQATVEPSDDIMPVAIQINTERQLANFNFAKEMDDLQSNNQFDLSFIGETCNDSKLNKNDGQNSVNLILEINKSRNQVEIEQLTKVEITLQQLKTKLKTITTDNIVLNVTNSIDLANNSIDLANNSIHDSDSNYSFGEFFDQPKIENKDNDKVGTDMVLPDYIPLSSDNESPNVNIEDTCHNIVLRETDPKSEAKIFLTKEHARLLLSTQRGRNLLNEPPHQVEVSMNFSTFGNTLLVVGTQINQDKFHIELRNFLEELNKKMQQKNEALGMIPKSKMGLIRFIREQFSLLEQPLGNVNELYKNIIRNEKQKSKAGTRSVYRDRKKLNIILMGRAGLRDGRFHLTGLERNLKFLLEHTKNMMTKQTRENVFQHYQYIFSRFEHDNYPELIAQYEVLKKTNNFPPINIDRRLLELKINVKDDTVDSDAKEKLMKLKKHGGNAKTSDLLVEHELANPVQAMQMQKHDSKTSKSEFKSPKTSKSEIKSPKTSKTEPKSPKVSNETANVVVCSVEDQNQQQSKKNMNDIWSLKCKEIVEKCRKSNIKLAAVTEKLDIVMDKACKNQLSYADYKHLEKIWDSLSKNCTHHS